MASAGQGGKAGKFGECGDLPVEIVNLRRGYLRQERGHPFR